MRKKSCEEGDRAIVTTHALRSLLGLLASSLKWLVRPLGKGSNVQEHAYGNVVRLWLVAWRRSELAMLADPRTFVHMAGGVVNLDSSV